MLTAMRINNDMRGEQVETNTAKGQRMAEMNDERD